MTLLIRDEEDIIESNILYHHAHGVDEFVVTDNGSVDRTLDIIYSLAKTIPMHIFHESSTGYAQYKWVTQMARYASKELSPDWIINADADELFVCRQGTMKSSLARVPPSVAVLKVKRHDFVPVAPSDGAPVPVWMRYRKPVTLNFRGVPHTPKSMHRPDENVQVTQGNHAAYGPKLKNCQDFHEIELFHYPIRTYPQFESKVRTAGYGYASNPEHPPQNGSHKRLWYAMLQEGKLHDEYRTQFYDMARLESALVSGELIEDDCVVGRFERLLIQTHTASTGTACL